MYATLAVNIIVIGVYQTLKMVFNHILSISQSTDLMSRLYKECYNMCVSFGKIKIDPNDKLFSIMVRERDGNKCVFCGKTSEQASLQNSHFWGRGDKVNRFNPLNCDTLCFYDHMQNEGIKQGKYRDFKLKQLGKKIYQEMERNHYQSSKKYGEFEKKQLNAILKEQYKNGDHLKPNWTVLW